MQLIIILLCYILLNICLNRKKRVGCSNSFISIDEI